jgi:glycosyltransferase involved in cell wall biosynthesis
MPPASLPDNARIVHLVKMVGVSGMERHLLSLLPGLRACGLDARIIVLVEPDKPMTEYLQAMQRLGVPAEALVISRDFDPGLMATLAKKFREGGYYGVHTHLIHGDIHGLIAAKLAGIRHIFSTAHNDDRFRRLLPIRIVQAILWRQVEAGIAISESLRQFLIRVEFAPPDHIHTVRYGLDRSSVQIDPAARQNLRAELSLDPQTPLVGSVCRLVEQKGLRYAIQAFAQIADQVPAAHFIIAGDGPLKTSLQQQAADLGLRQRMHFLGWRTDSHSLLAAVDVLLMPSLWEGFGLVMLEAMASATPIIASNVSALPEIVVDGETGFLVPPADPESLADKMIHLLKNPDQAREMGHRGQRRLDSVFSVDRMVQQTLKVYGRS